MSLSFIELHHSLEQFLRGKFRLSLLKHSHDKSEFDPLLDSIHLRRE